MAESNFLSIENDFSQDEQVTDLLFADDSADDLEDIKKKAKEKEEADKKKTALKVPPTTPPKKPIPEEEEETDETPIDGTKALFGDEEEEETKDEASKEESKDEDKEEIEDEQEKSQFEILSTEFYKMGVFKPDVDEDSGEEITHIAKTPEEFKKLFEYQQQTGMFAMIDNYLSKFGEDRYQLFDAVFNKGVDPKDYLPVYNALQDFKSMSLETEENQEKVVREFYKRSGLSDEKVGKQIQRLKDTAELQSEAEDLHPMIIKQDEQAIKKQEDDRLAIEQQEQQKDIQYKGSLVKILQEKLQSKDFDGIPVNEKVAQKAFDFMYNKKWQGKDGKKFTDYDKFLLELNKPENHALKVKVGLLALNNFDLAKVQKKAISKESSELFSELTQKKVKRDSAKKEQPKPWNL